MEDFDGAVNGGAAAVEQVAQTLGAGVRPGGLARRMIRRASGVGFEVFKHGFCFPVRLQ